jgi:superfamily I DNA and/or RNA helicase
MREHHATEYDF